MADERPTHLWIPTEGVRTERIEPHGGGTTFQRANITEHAQRLVSSYRILAERVARKIDADSTSDVYIQVRTESSRPIRQERMHLANLGLDVIAISPVAENVAIARTTRRQLPVLEQWLVRYASTPTHVGRTNVAAIEEITDVPAEEKIDEAILGVRPDAVADCLIALYTAIPAPEKGAIAERLAFSLTTLGKRGVRIRRFANGTTAIAAELTGAEIRDIGEQWLSVRSIEPNADVLVETAVRSEPLPRVVGIDPPRCAMPVAVVDSGINANSVVLQGLVQDVLAELPAGSIGPHREHGTFVGSRILYGDDIVNVASRRLSPWCSLIDVQVVGVDAIGNKTRPKGDELGEVLQRVVPSLASRTRVFNLSLGHTSIRSRKFSELAKLLDYLARQHQVLFVVSAGNIDDPQGAPPAHFAHENARLTAPAESLLSISVGSVAKFAEAPCSASAQEISPFSCRGPGADEGRKPEVVAHGGNAFHNGAAWVTTPRVGSYGITGDGLALSYGVGTSYAAPLIAQYAARLFDAYPTATPNLVRALLVHFTEDVTTPHVPPLEHHHYCGFGEPNIQRALFASAQGATFLYQGSIQRDNFQYLPFLVPRALANNSASRLKIRGTVVFDPPVNPDNAAEYCQSRISFLLRKRSEVGFRDVQVGGEENDHRLPWNPILHFQKPFRRGYAAGEWELRLRLMTRGSLPVDFSQTYAVIVEVLDESGTVNVHDEVLAEMPGAYVPVSLRIAA